jgi:hypothetical protein
MAAHNQLEHLSNSTRKTTKMTRKTTKMTRKTTKMTAMRMIATMKNWTSSTSSIH